MVQLAGREVGPIGFGLMGKHSPLHPPSSRTRHSPYYAQA